MECYHLVSVQMQSSREKQRPEPSFSEGAGQPRREEVPETGVRLSPDESTNASIRSTDIVSRKYNFV